jgi:hypothetical protein
MTGRTLAVVAGAVLLAAIAVGRIAATYSVYSNTFDEPDHIAAGMEWWERGMITFDPMHPPLGRAAVALGPYVAGVRIREAASPGRAANAVLYDRGKYVEDLTLARIGILPFFLAAVAAVWVWARRLAGNAAALIAVALFTTTPLVLAHAGLATTDMPLTGTLLWALFAIVVWLDDQSIRNGAVVGATGGLALASKLSAVLFLPLCGAAFVAVRWLVNRRRRDTAAVVVARSLDVRRIAASVAVGAVVAFLVVWSTYRFSIGPRFGTLVPGGVPMPLPELVDGMRLLVNKNSHGHPAFLLDEYRTTGWWYFFPLGVAVKTPIALLVLTIVGAIAAIRTARARGDWRYVAPIAAAVAMLASAMTSKINIGIRHVLPMFPLMAITAAIGVLWLWNLTRYRAVGRVVVAALFVWQVGASVRAHPDYLPYFNELAGSHPEHLLRDSDLDWGQDLLRLADTVRARGIDTLNIAYWGKARVSQLVPAVTRPFGPADHPVGWIAISEQWLSHANPEYAGFRWLRSIEPTARVGKTIKLYRVTGPVGAAPR